MATSNEKKITRVQIVPAVPAQGIWVNKILGVLEGDTNMMLLLEYYPDELRFTPEEILGKTLEEVRHLHFLKDKAYLQS